MLQHYPWRSICTININEMTTHTPQVILILLLNRRSSLCVPTSTLEFLCCTKLICLPCKIFSNYQIDLFQPGSSARTNELPNIRTVLDLLAVHAAKSQPGDSMTYSKLVTRLKVQNLYLSWKNINSRFKMRVGFVTKCVIQNRRVLNFDSCERSVMEHLRDTLRYNRVSIFRTLKCLSTFATLLL